MFEWIGFIGMFLVQSSYIPQIYQTIKTKKSRDLNLRFWSILWIGFCFYLAYALLILNIVYIVSNIIALTQSGLQLYLTRRYK